MRVDDLHGRRVAVWGAGVEGRAAVRFVQRHVRAAELVVVVDHDPAADAPIDVLPSVPVLSSVRDAAAVGRAEVVIKSPGVSPYHGPLAELVRRGTMAVTGGTQLWFAEAAARDRLGATIGVTGSKGKSTTSSLVAHLLVASGAPAVLAGNVGRAPIDLLDEWLDTASAGASGAAGAGASDAGAATRTVLELSSFQASEVRHAPGVGVLTSLFPEHLDWHETVDRYYADKCNLFAHGDGALVANLTNNDVATRTRSHRHRIAYGTSDGVHLHGAWLVDAGGARVLDLAASPLRGEHNALNLCGALTAVVAAGVALPAPEALAEALASFRPLEHRLQPVGEWHGRAVVDDSLSTAPQAAVAALAAYAEVPVSIIVGGHDRGLDYAALADAVAARSMPVFVAAVPQSGPRIAELVAARCAAGGTAAWQVYDDFDDAVLDAAARTPEGGAILLSPAAPSFGRFRDYRERGRHFRELLGLA